MNVLQQFGISGLWKAKKSTFIGAALIVAGAIIDYYQGSGGKTALVAGLIAGPFLAWKGKLVQSGVATLCALLVGCGLLAAAPACADDAAPAPAFAGTPLACATVFGTQHCAYGVAGFSGSAYDLKHASTVRNFQASGLVEAELIKDKLGLAAGAALQTGDVYGLNWTAALTFPVIAMPAGLVPAAGATGTIFGSADSLSLILGIVKRF